jgi:signal transduction histidine kinase
VARIIEEHGGTLELADRSDGQRGASVRIRLPRGPASGTGPITETLQLESTAHGS